MPASLSLILTLQFRAAVSAAVLLAVGVAVRHLWDADQELAVIPEDHHGQLASALFHQVFGLQQGQILRCHPIDLVEGNKSVHSEINCYILDPSSAKVHLQNEVSFLQSSFLGSQPSLCHVLDEDLTAQLESVLWRRKPWVRNLPPPPPPPPQCVPSLPTQLLPSLILFFLSVVLMG